MPEMECLRWQHREIRDNAAVLCAGFRGGSCSSLGRDFGQTCQWIIQEYTQRLGERARDSDFIQCQVPQTQSHTRMCSLRFVVVDLPELDSMCHIMCRVLLLFQCDLFNCY